jgi:hypothetical protein
MGLESQWEVMKQSLVEATQSSLSLGIIHFYQFTFNLLLAINVNSKNS